MISDSNKKLAQWALEYAQKCGCQSARVGIGTGSNTSFELRDGRMDKLQQASENQMSIQLYVDGRFGSFTTNRLDKKELETSIKNSVESTRYLAKDEDRSLPDAALFYKGGNPDLELLDPKLASIQPDDKVALAKATAEEVLGKDERIISVSTSYSDGENFGYILTSNGFEGETKRSWYSLSADVTIKGEGEARPSGWWYQDALFFDKLIKEGIGRTALERVLRKLGQKKIQSGKYTMVLDPMVSSSLLRPMLSALTGQSLQQKNSFLLDKLGAKVGSDKFTLVDEPHLIGASGARYFDGEGVATERRTIFGNGMLNTYFIDTYSARKMKVKPTISGPSILIMQTGAKDLNGLVADVPNGILVTGFNGGNCNSTTGDFSYGVEGFLIENGKLTQPLSEMNVTGNMITLWNSLVETGNDPRLTSSWRIPSLVFEGVDFSGL